MEGLRSLLIDSSFIHDILKLNVQPSDSDYAVDIRSPAVYVSLQTYRDVLCMYSFYTVTSHPSNNKYSSLHTAVNSSKQCLFSLQWINNLETDGRYSSWPSTVQELLRPTFPGVIRQIRKNFHNLVCTASLSCTVFQDISVILNRLHGKST